MKQPLTFCITLKDHTYSMLMLDECLKTANQHRWKIEPFWAVDGSKLTEASWKTIGVTPRNDKKGFFKSGTHGCFFSHWELWNRCVNLNCPIIILEQDAVINQQWDESLSTTTHLIKLHTVYSSKASTVDIDTGNWTRSAHAYMIGPDQAQKLISWAKNFGACATDMIIGSNVLNFRHLDYELIGRNKNRQSTTSAI